MLTSVMAQRHLRVLRARAPTGHAMKPRERVEVLLGLLGGQRVTLAADAIEAVP
jgi:hypothetical protein